jgi:hypothetical protein
VKPEHQAIAGAQRPATLPHGARYG